MMASQSDARFKPGTIKSLKLINFMCHETFELKFGPAVNFVIGPNGSGKSALLTAVVVVLGGRASTTSRAKKANDFIMYGKDCAKISLVIHNYDKIMDINQAFKPDDYGKEITIEKTLFKDGVSKLVLKNDKDKRVSERKRELDDMLEHFGILINNPICILNQEISKTFLHSKKPEDKFSLFMKATNLETIEEDYSSAKKSHNEWDDCNNRNSLAFKLLDAEYNNCKDKTNFLQNRTKLSDRALELNRELIWAHVRDNEKLKEDINLKKIEISDKIEKAKSAIECREEKVKELDCKIQIAESKINTHLDTAQNLQRKLEDHRKAEHQVKTKRLDNKSRIDRIKSEIKHRDQNKDALEKSIADFKRQFRDQNELDHDNEKRKLEIEHLERELETQQAREKTLRLNTSQLGSSMTATRTELHKSGLKINELKSKISQSQAALRRLKNGQENGLRKYGDPIVKVLEEIDKAHQQGRFKRKPIGPLGYYLKLKLQEIAPSLEVQLGRNAHAFACDNHADMTALLTIFRRILPRDFRQPLILTRPFGRKHDVSRFKAVHPTYKTLLDYLDIEKEEVHNAILDRTQLESILYIPNYKDAENLMINPSLIPKNTRSAYTREASCMYPRTASGGYKCMAYNASGALFLESNSNQIKDREREIELLEAELRDATHVYKGYEDSSKSQRAEYDLNQQELIKIVNNMRELEKSLLNLKTTVVVEPQEISALETELEANVRQIGDLNLSLDVELELMKSVEEELKQVISDKEACAKFIEKNDLELKEVRKNLQQSKSTKQTCIDEIKEKQIVIVSETKDMERQDAKLDEVLKSIAETMQKLGDEVRRPVTIRQMSVIKEELMKISAQLRAEEAENRDPVELIESLKRRMIEIENLNFLKDHNLRNFDASAKTLADRHDGFLRLRSATVHGVSSTFSTILRAMNMDGRLSIYLDDRIERGHVINKAKTLEMSIDTNYNPSQRVGSVMSDSNNNTGGDRRTSHSQPANLHGPRSKRARLDVPGRSRETNEKENGNSRMNDARSLSGGERSFSTVGFVLALWHHCSSPFKIMDEIDVFMDMVTRRVSYNALIRFAESREESGQFLFFSPLELPKFEDTSIEVRVFEMPAIIRKRPHSQISQDPQEVLVGAS